MFRADRLKKTLVIGIGNILMSDDGIGPKVVNSLLVKYRVPRCIEVIDGGTQGLNLLQYFDDVKDLIIVDAVVSRNKRPGEIVKIAREEIGPELTRHMSVHDIGFVDVMSALKLLGKMPGRMVLIGMVPAKMEFGYGLSEIVEGKLESLTGEIVKQLTTWNIEGECSESLPVPRTL